MLSLIYRIPIIGWMLREGVEGDDTSAIVFVITLLLIWALVGVLFGIQGIVTLALIAVPIIFTLLILIAWGR